MGFGGRSAIVASLAAALGAFALWCAPFAAESSSGAADGGGPDAPPPTVDGATVAVDGQSCRAPPALSAYAQVVLADSPLMYFQLDEAVGATAALSAVSCSSPATIYGAPTLGVPGKIGKGYGFDGQTAAYLELTDAVLQFDGTTPFTLEAWYFANKADNQYRHIFIKDTSTGPRQEYGLWTFLDGTYGPQLGFERYVSGASDKAIADAGTKTWHHAVAVYDSATVSLWLDGALVSQMNDTDQAQDKDKPLLIGTRDPGDGMFDGIIDEVAIYSHALKSDRILNHYNAGNQ